MFDTVFLNGETWGFPGRCVEHVETHAAHVFLVADRAFKMKKDVKLPYLDFSTVEKRRAVLEKEFDINHAFAPDIYIGTGEVRGEPVLVMRRFPANGLLSWKLSHGGIGAGLARSLGELAAKAHERAPRRGVKGSAIMLGLGAQLSKAFISSPDIFRPAETLEFHALYEEALHRHKALLNDRSEQGLVRRCHGDMHSGNIVVENGTPVLFDAIEFSEDIATIDVLYDLAFLLMDLWQHEERAAADIVLNHYFNLRRKEEDLSGLALLPLFLSTRAGVRALVTADLAHELPLQSSMKPRGQALDWFRASIAYLKPQAPRLICVGGFSGSGKSTLAASLAPEIGAAPGAIHVRSDVERKAMAGLPETSRLPPEAYSRQSSVAVYAVSLTRADRALAAGHSVVLDAVFSRDSERGLAEGLAKRWNACFTGIWLDAPASTLKERVSLRRGDASDAGPAVVDQQLGYDIGHLQWPRVDASGSPQQTLEAVRRMLRCRDAVPA
jgi:uncharacterized protein